MARFNSGPPTFYRAHEYDDDARSVSSVASYLDPLNPPLTARLPPAVRVRTPSDHHRSRAPSGFRLSQLEEKLQELEMQDWKTDRLILSAEKDRHGQSLADDMHGSMQRNDGRPRQGQREWEQHGAHKSYAAEDPRIRTPNPSARNLRIGELSQEGSKSMNSFGSPFSPNDSLFRNLTYTPARPAHHMNNDTPGVHTKYEELAALRKDTDELRASSGTANASDSALKRESERLREQIRRRELDAKYSSTPEGRVLERFTLDDNKAKSGPGQALEYYDMKYASSPEKTSLSRSAGALPLRIRPSFQEMIGNRGHGLGTVQRSTPVKCTSGKTDGPLDGIKTKSDSKQELAQQLLDHLLGQYFRKSAVFRAFVSMASRSDEGSSIEWVQWWPELEKDVRLSIRPEMKAVYDSRCSELFTDSKKALRELFQQAPRSPTQGPLEPERRLTMKNIEKCADEATLEMLKGSCDAHGLAALNGLGLMTWDEFWPKVEGFMKSAVKDHMRKVVKEEILAQFTDWRRRFHGIFTAVDKEATGKVQAVAFLRQLQESNLGLILGLYRDSTNVAKAPQTSTKNPSS